MLHAQSFSKTENTRTSAAQPVRKKLKEKQAADTSHVIAVVAENNIAHISRLVQEKISKRNSMPTFLLGFLPELQLPTYRHGGIQETCYAIASKCLGVVI